MKQTFVCFFIVGILGLGVTQAQQTKFLIEFGGKYKKTNYNLDEVSILASNSLRTPTIQPRLGIFVSKHTAIGLSYDFEKQKGETRSTIGINDFQLQQTINMSGKTHSFGAFYRHYFRPVDVSRWNVFLELNPNYQTSKQVTKYTRMDKTNDNTWLNSSVNVSELIQQTKEQGIDANLRVGASYRLAKSLHLQLTMPNIARVYHVYRKEENEVEQEKTTTFTVFSDPFSNASLSVLFTL